MPYVDRFSVSLDTELLAAFDRHIAERGYTNRSEAIRDMIRGLLVDARLEQGDEPAVGILVAVCDGHEAEAQRRVRACLAAAVDVYHGAFHIPVAQKREAMAIALRGPAERIQGIANRLQSFRGVSLVRLTAVPLSDLTHMAET
jgi:CopG family nickel-responsive transcriptional regulator